jgi:hypothetical protein
MIITKAQIDTFLEKRTTDFITFKTSTIKNKYPKYAEGKNDTQIEAYIRDKISFGRNFSFHDLQSFSFFIDIDLHLNLFDAILRDPKISATLRDSKNLEEDRIDSIKDILLGKYIRKF